MVFYRLPNPQRAKNVRFWTLSWEKYCREMGIKRRAINYGAKQGSWLILMPKDSKETTFWYLMDQKKMMGERVDLFVFSLFPTLSWGPKIYQSRKRKISQLWWKKKREYKYERSWQMILSRTYWTHFAVTEGITIYLVVSEISVKWAVNSCYFTETVTIVSIT